MYKLYWRRKHQLAFFYVAGEFFLGERAADVSAPGYVVVVDLVVTDVSGRVWISRRGTVVLYERPAVVCVLEKYFVSVEDSSLFVG